MSGPFFSVLVSAYDRAPEVLRCVGSCQAQTFEDFEVVVVDDGSTDATAEALAELGDPRLRVVRHERNRGISAARATAVKHAVGEWFVVLDSDWELFPHALARLRAVIDELPPGVHIVRSRLQGDDGSLQPEIMPSGITGYHERLRWLEQLTLNRASSDAGHCIHRSVFETTNYFEDRRGAMEGLWETNLARRERSLWLADILGMQHVDAPNSHSRDTDPSRLIPRLLLEAPDDLWMAETMLAEHGAELARYAPRTRRTLMERAATQAFLTGDRRRGLRHTVRAVRSGSYDAKVWVTAGLGLLGPRALAHAKVAGRRRRPGAPRQPAAA
jgi:glycosyltransferase involved in cell wall biosynthesis